jgi:uncharacterized surface protein with fasciclin (FAS1) repeats
MTRIRTLLAVLAVSALAVAAVGPSASAAGRQQPNIVGTASSSKQFSTLTDLLTRAGLVSTLNKKGPYTVFAPTNAAFAKVPKATIDALLADKAKLRAVLLYHVVPGKVLAKDVVKLTSAKTAEGDRVGIRVAGSNVFVDGAKVTTADVKASNGVIHVVNRVLIP